MCGVWYETSNPPCDIAYVTTSHSFEACRVKKKKTEYLLNWVPPETSQEEYYTYFEGVVSSFVAHCNCDAAILAYGATGSGKTFSTQGPELLKFPAVHQHGSELSPTVGIIQRAIQQILQVSAFPFWPRH